MSKNYEELRLSDRFLFGKVMEDSSLCREVLECLLGQSMGELEMVETQSEYHYKLDGKSTRLDIYTGDREIVFDAESQNQLLICTFDPFGADLPQYTFRNRCDEMPEIVLQDTSVKYFFNCTCQGIEIPENIQALYRYIMTGEPSDELTNKIHIAVKAGLCNEKWKTEYLKDCCTTMI